MVHPFLKYGIQAERQRVISPDHPMKLSGQNIGMLTNNDCQAMQNCSRGRSTRVGELLSFDFHVMTKLPQDRTHELD